MVNHLPPSPHTSPKDQTSEPPLPEIEITHGVGSSVERTSFTNPKPFNELAPTVANTEAVVPVPKDFTISSTHEPPT